MKMLRPSTIRTDLPMWDLMMKNIYNLNAPQIQQLNFQFRIMYRDDMTGIDNPSLHEGIQTQNRPLLQIFGLDRLNPNNDPQPDGNFDFVPSLTIDPTAGRIIFPVLEPFGSNLKAYFEPSLELQLINKYVFQELYTGTQADAQLLTNKSKFFLKGSYMSSTSNEIILPGMNIAPQSVSVRAGNTLLTEGADYTVDYQLGRVRLTNTGVLSSGKDIIIQYERADLFNFQQRNFMGLEAEYRFNKDFKIVGTVLHLNERPLITRVTMNNEPLRNTLWGIAGNYRKESGFLTRMVDKIPFVDTKEKSVFAFSGEFAQLIPGTNQMLKQNGSVETSYIDDFESSEIPYELGRMPTAWRLGSTPRNLIPNSGFANPLDYNNLRANLTWYSIDNTAFYSGGFQGSAPDNITEEDKLNHYTRMVLYNEIAKGRDAQQVNLPEQTFDLAFYPEERGAYNFNTNLLRNGKLPSPEKNFGSITRGITHDIDFDNINVQYLEFWLLDPFLTGKNGQIIYQDLDGLNKGVNNVSGGDLEIHLGNISEDVIPDGRHNFENGIPTDGNSDQIAKTAWGNAPKQQYLTDAFAAGSDSRGKQDIGLDGATDEEERIFFKDYIEEIKTKLNDLSLSRITEDPAGDNFKHFLDGNYTDKNAKILTRYTRFNNMQGNSPENSGNNSSYQTPDNEDLNRDNTISDLESFYKYKISIKPGMLEKGVNPYVVAQVTTKAKKSNDEITWYQFRIPIREFQEKYGDIDGFKSIRFVRLFMQGWTQPVVLRMSQFQFVGAQWRPYLGDLQTPGLNKPLEPYNPSFTVGTVNIERNGLFDGKNTPYMLPPGFKRDVDPTSVTQARQNEQSLRVCVEGLQDTDSRGVFKNMNFDFVNYKRVQMFIHAESDDAKDEEMSAFLRLGTDFKENFYEVEVPLVMTPKGSTGERQVWPLENEIDFELSNFINIKAERNKKRLSMTVPYTVKIGRYNVTVVGNPDLSNLQTAMLGVRNPRSADELPRSVCVWFNELRVAEFNKEAGWAANARLQMQLADFAQINASLRYSTPFFGGLQDKISQRSRETIFYYDVNSTVNLDKILLNRIGISLPMFVSYEQSLTTPLFNPLDPDTRLDQSMDTRFQDNKDDFMSKVQARLTRKSINFTNVRKTKVNPKAQKHFYDVENWAFTYSYADEVQSDIQIAVRERMNSKIGLNYAYSFEAKPWKPLSKSELFNSPYLKLLRDFNFTLTPQTIGFNGVLNRNYTKMQMRNAELTTAGMPAFFEKSYMFDRNYNARWKFTDGLTFDYNSAVNAIIDEPEGEINTEVKRDSVMNNLRKLGRTKFFKQDVVFNYKLPLEKIPFTDFISADAKYNAGYQWSAGAVGMADTLGNLARNTNQFTLAGQINMQKLYDKSPLLKQLTASGKTKPSSKAAKTEDEKTKRLKFRLSKISEKKSKNAKKREEKKLLRLQALKNDYARKSAADSLISVPADSLFADSLFYADILGKYWKKQNKYLKRQNRLEEKLKKHAQKLTEKAAKEQNQPASPALNTIAKVLFSVKKINITYNSNRATNLPGYLPRPSYFGLNENLDMASLPFILGGQSRNMILDMAAKGLISKSSVQTMPYQQTLDKKINLTATVEPTKGFQLTIEASRANGAAFSEIIRYDPTAEQYNFESATRNGNYTISFITLRTAFDRVDAQKNSPVFDKFIAARGDVKAFLDAQNPEGPYLANSQDVILPAFLQAYTGKKQKSPSAFPQIPLPNWRLNYSGLSELEMFKNIFSSITLSHGYSASYSTGNFTSSLLYDADYINLDISEANMLYGRRDPVTGVLVPVLVMNQVSVTEKFSPLVGFNIKTKSDITARIDFNKQRSLTMNLNNAQLTEIKSSDITIDVGLRKKNFKIPFTETVLKNDLTFRFALTLRDNVTYQRRIENEKQLTTVTAGNMNLRINPTLAYMVTKQLTTTAYFDYSLNNPVISNSFRRTNTNFGIQLLYRLAP
jgi:cell surface protein SprA